MSAKQTTKAAAEQSADKDAPPPRPREAVSVRVKTKSPGVKRQVCGVIFENTWKYLTLDDRGSAYKAIARDPAMVMEKATPPPKPVATEESTGKEAK
ncbi:MULTISPECIES: hypothetical protein [unclassified Halomonas]|jgi:hypothetical protein|uniref:hypothetical protein n=1 Tax=Halomonas sp. 15WGF TaxID=2570357 RepID=UPI000E9598C8|nr:MULTISPECIES: hypothetical protein [unclassified Halomonas]TKJ11112.1 hypothetical protein E8Q34_07280 [Halomonas sp. 15WGF]HBN61402.1 hypothetical protein [Halomonas sp.]|tara:strand:- start:13857 stop:14147 length:291 start_codon:yes stop_codon:yes gene_type:complete